MVVGNGVESRDGGVPYFSAIDRDDSRSQVRSVLLNGKARGIAKEIIGFAEGLLAKKGEDPQAIYQGDDFVLSRRGKKIQIASSTNIPGNDQNVTVTDIVVLGKSTARREITHTIDRMVFRGSHTPYDASQVDSRVQGEVSRRSLSELYTRLTTSKPAVK